jgi:hypothetical protein
MPCLGGDGRRMTGALAELMSPTALIMGDLAIGCYASVSVQKNQATVVTERAKIVAPEIEIRGTVRGALGDPGGNVTVRSYQVTSVIFANKACWTQSRKADASEPNHL